MLKNVFVTLIGSLAIAPICLASADEHDRSTTGEVSAVVSEVVSTPTEYSASIDPKDGAIITVGFYLDDKCTNGTEVAKIQYNISTECFGWTRNTAEGGTRDNSANNFQCYRDRVCYTQYVNSIDCMADVLEANKIGHNKEFTTDSCTKDTGKLWSKIISGTEMCPVAPEDFQCPE